jgi:hypothetical protein
MRLRLILGAAVLLVATMAPGAAADEFDKLTYFTFSGPVQIPGAILPAGTYMFKLADPETARRVVQIFDKPGTKLYATVLTIPEQRRDTDPRDINDSIIMFNEAPAGEPQAVRTWVYAGETTGYELVYPKDQALRIAKAAHTGVLAVDNGTASDRKSLQGAPVARIDEKGQPSETTRAAAAAPQRSSPAPSQSVSGASSTSSTSRAASGNSAARSASAAASSTPAAAPAAAPPASANAAAPQSQPVGTAGQRPSELPKTASQQPLLQLISASMLLSAAAVRQLRRRSSES